MKHLASLLLALITPIFAQEKTLSDIDRELLLEQLQEIQNNSDTTIKGRFGVALAAFQKARESDSAAHQLYLDCVEKIRFENEAKKASEFREWKNRHKDRTDSPGFRLALRHQLNWLCLTLEAAQQKEVTALSTKSLAVLEAILRDAEKLKGQQARLKESVLKTIFAEAYEVTSVKVAGWPEAPLSIEAIYDSIVLPPLRTPSSTDALRQGWLKRIEHEGLLLQEWTNEASADRDRKPAFERWLVEGRKNLMWKMEVDLFRNGDQRGSALRMLEHLKANLTHKSAPKWIGEFTLLVEGKPLDEETNDDAKTKDTQ